MDQAQQRTAGWAALAEAAFTEVTAWRQQHPTATLREIETMIDEETAQNRGRLRDLGFSIRPQIEAGIPPAEHSAPVAVDDLGPG